MTQPELFPKQTFGQKCATRINSEVASLSDVEGIAAIIDDERRKLIAQRAPLIAPKLTKNERAPLFTALCVATGGSEAQLTKTAKKALALALNELIEVTPGLSAQEIASRAAAYRSRHPTWPLTPMSLVKHWSELGSGSQTRSGRLDPYSEPPDWRNVVRARFPDVAEAMLGQWDSWGQIPVDYRLQMVGR